MSTQQARPEFGKPKRTPDFYLQVRAFIESLRSTTTMREIAILLNRAGFTTPTGKQWCRQSAMNIMRKQHSN